MRIDAGSGWVQRWFAKPLAKGSIPSRVSILSKMLDRPNLKYLPLRFYIGRLIGKWALSAPDGYRSLRGGVIYPISLIERAKVYRSAGYVNMVSQSKAYEEQKRLADKYKADLVDARKQLSKLKRSN